ncbi:uncharacterized protein Z518_11059 [Rhinocladiella mackenziei CBS 650.93]|uniref:Protein kinase domain-containing protein n=1 Tax=Rhinocladiella mackenziei CBS 650.93 TaxID=1442369 RepID=A0A0D2FC04_9EURO|nr:uncharacterized protein Z518_11059 [Rhinocladiella mackenziei CBS 650.93]KIW99646.1 hypothetical protein Z518_11059 [Rhinocladiella mackenziei CBS 650.93]
MNTLLSSLCHLPVSFVGNGQEMLQSPDISDITSLNLEFIGGGFSGLVYAIDGERVLKEYSDFDDRDRDTEHRAYERLGSHPNIARYFGATKDGSIILERGRCLQTIYQQSGGTAGFPLSRKLRWAREAAAGLRHAHEKGILQADVGCHNMMLTRDDRLKIFDFAGCSIDGEEAASCYKWFSYRPSTPEVSIQTDLFAYGCALYEIETGRHPYHELETFDDRERRIKQLYQEKKFPHVTHLILGEVIQDCWNGKFNSMGEVIQALPNSNMRAWSCWSTIKRLKIHSTEIVNFLRPPLDWWKWLRNMAGYPFSIMRIPHLIGSIGITVTRRPIPALSNELP